MHTHYIHSFKRAAILILFHSLFWSLQSPDYIFHQFYWLSLSIWSRDHSRQFILQHLRHGLWNCGQNNSWLHMWPFGIWQCHWLWHCCKQGVSVVRATSSSLSFSRELLKHCPSSILSLDILLQYIIRLFVENRRIDLEPCVWRRPTWPQHPAIELLLVLLRIGLRLIHPLLFHRL